MRIMRVVLKRSAPWKRFFRLEVTTALPQAKK